MSSRKTRIPLFTKKKPSPSLASPTSFRKQNGALIVTNLILVVYIVVVVVAVVLVAAAVAVVVVCVCVRCIEKDRSIDYVVCVVGVVCYPLGIDQSFRFELIQISFK